MAAPADIRVSYINAQQRLYLTLPSPHGSVSTHINNISQWPSVAEATEAIEGAGLGRCLVHKSPQFRIDGEFAYVCVGGAFGLAPSDPLCLRCRVPAEELVPAVASALAARDNIL